VTKNDRVIALRLFLDGDELFVLLRRTFDRNGEGFQGYGIAAYNARTLMLDWETGVSRDPKDVLPGSFGIQPTIFN
jgi:hypothetical protein